jgi:hypothetical protein
VPTNCTLSFTPTIARSATTALTISATDAYTSCSGCGCNNCAAACSGGNATLVISGLVGDSCVVNKMNGTYNLIFRGLCGWSIDSKSGSPECPTSVGLTLGCISPTGKWFLRVYVGAAPPDYEAYTYPLLNCTGTHPTGSGVFTSWTNCSGGSWTLT